MKWIAVMVLAIVGVVEFALRAPFAFVICFMLWLDDAVKSADGYLTAFTPFMFTLIERIVTEDQTAEVRRLESELEKTRELLLLEDRR